MSLFQGSQGFDSLIENRVWAPVTLLHLLPCGSATQPSMSSVPWDLPLPPSLLLSVDPADLMELPSWRVGLKCFCVHPDPQLFSALPDTNLINTQFSLQCKRLFGFSLGSVPEFHCHLYLLLYINSFLCIRPSVFPFFVRVPATVVCLICSLEDRGKFL